jgi:hypothetical protein
MQEEIHRFLKKCLARKKSFYSIDLAGFQIVLDCFRFDFRAKKYAAKKGKNV